MELTLSLLGESEIKLNGESLENLRAEKAYALLFYLAVESDHAHRREVLAEMFWPEKPEGYGRNSLKQALALLRGALGDRNLDDPFIISSNRDLQFNPGSKHRVDVLEFEELMVEVNSHPHDNLNSCESCFQKLTQAAALYQDELLMDFYLPDSPEFNEWVLSKRETCKRMVDDVLFKLIAYHKNQNEYKTASEYGERLVTLEPWKESSHRIQMELLAACGKRSAAMKQFHTCERMLESEFGIKPAPATTALYQKIQQWNVKEGEMEIHSVPPGGNQTSSIIETRTSPIPQSKVWIISSVVFSFLVLMGVIYIAQVNKYDQGNILSPGPSITPTNTPGVINGDPSLFILLGAPGDVLSTQNCLPGEQLLYQEDFQENQVEDWPEIDFRVQGWDLVSDPLFPGNQVARNPGDHETQIWNHNLLINNAVWRANFMIQGEPRYIFQWNWKLDPYKGDDGIVQSSGFSIGLDPEAIRVVRGLYPGPEVFILDNPIFVEKEVWHVIEISTYQDIFELWIDGTQIVEFTDPDPLPGGLIGLEIWLPLTEDSLVYYDNFQVCELAEPFIPRYTAKP